MARADGVRTDRTSPGRGYRAWVTQDAGEEAFENARHRVALWLLAHASLANVFACFEDLMGANPLSDTPPDRPMFAPRLVAADPSSYRSLSGASVKPDRGLLPDVQYDAIVVPVVYDAYGYLSGHEATPIVTPSERDWLLDQHRGGALIVTMCSGTFPLAETGLLDGHRCSVIPLFEATFRTRFPDVEGVTNRTIVVSGADRELVSGGFAVYSADVSLYMVAHFCGAPLAVLIADLYGKAWETPLDGRVGTRACEGARDLEDATVRLARRFIAEHLGAPSVIHAAAELAHISERTLRRRFVHAIGMTPREYLRTQRIEKACDLLVRTRLPIDEISVRVGYADRSTFARAFRGVQGLPPADYRRRFHRPARMRKEGIETLGG